MPAPLAEAVVARNEMTPSSRVAGDQVAALDGVSANAGKGGCRQFARADDEGARPTCRNLGSGKLVPVLKA